MILMGMKRVLLLFYVCVGLVFLNSCARNPVTGKRQLVLMSEKQEIGKIVQGQLGEK